MLSAWDLIPVFSWIFLGGACRKCRTKLSIEHPLREILTGVLFAGVGIFAGTDNKFILIWMLFITSILWILALYDFYYMEIADEIAIPSIFILTGVSITDTFYNLGIPDIFDALLGALIIGGFFFLQILIPHLLRLKKEWIGGGDLRLAAIIGIVLGWKVSILALFLAYILGAIISPILLLLKKKEVPFGPFLALSCYISLFYGARLANMWLDFTGLGSLYNIHLS
jgi:prepilin signal peptidase PulO-like enzyme (type II secretory pathway)